MISGRFTREETNRRIYYNVMREYVKGVEELRKKCKTIDKRVLCHVIKLVDSNDDKMLNDFGFNFNKYYDTFNTITLK